MKDERPKKKDFQQEIIKVFRMPEDKGTKIAVVRWIVDGHAWSPQLINQEVYIDRLDRKQKHGKMKGLSYGDWMFVMQHKDEITELLKDNPFRKERPDTQARAANDHQEERAPAFDPLEEEIPF